jgi:membrane-associated phospholipid phosphatase
MSAPLASDLGQLGIVAVTQLGDAWFLFALLLVVHWYRTDWLSGGRRASATVVAITLLAVGSVVTAKAGFALPRPSGAAMATVPTWLPQPLAAAVREGATADGFGFPSGHAVTATAVYGSLAAATGGGLGDRRPIRWRNWVAAGAVVAVITASRVALGVHVPRDVLAGVALGAAVLAVGLWLEDPTRVLGLAVVVGLAGTAIAATASPSPELPDAVGVLGGTLGGVAAWRWSGPVATRVPLGVVLVGGVGVTAIWAVSMSLDVLAVVGIGNALAVGAGLGFPALVDRATNW